MAKCPFCGCKLEWEFIQYKPRTAPTATLFCPNGDFISDEGRPTSCVAELESAYRRSKGGDE